MCSPTLIDAPVKPMLRDVVLAAAVRAAADLDVDLARELVGDVHRFDPLLHGLVQAHRAGDPELARVGPRARDDVGDLPRARLAQAELGERAPQVVDALLAHPAQHEVLLHGRARVAAGVLAHRCASPRNCSGVRSPRRTFASTVTKPSCFCSRTFAVAEALELREVAVRAAVALRRRGRALALVVEEQPVLDREVAFCHPVALQLLLDLVAQLVDAELVDEHLDPRAGAVHAQPLLAVEDAEDGLGDLQVLAVVELHELVQRRRYARHDRGAAADEHLRAADLARRRSRGRARGRRCRGCR